MAKPKEISLDDIIGSEDTKLIKPKQQKEVAMTVSTKKTAIVSVVSTLAVIAAIAGIFIAGMNYERTKTEDVNAKVNAAVMSVQEKASKDQQ